MEDSKRTFKLRDTRSSTHLMRMNRMLPAHVLVELGVSMVLMQRGRGPLACERQVLHSLERTLAHIPE